jgi:hypothetical protein
MSLWIGKAHLPLTFYLQLSTFLHAQQERAVLPQASSCRPQVDARKSQLVLDSQSASTFHLQLSTFRMRSRSGRFCLRLQVASLKLVPEKANEPLDWQSALTFDFLPSTFNFFACAAGTYALVSGFKLQASSRKS